MKQTPQNIAALLEKYFEKKSLAWAASTARSERARLTALLPYIDPTAPRRLWDRLADTASKYTRVTAWVSVTAFWDFVMKGEGGENPFRAFRVEHRRLFRNAYYRAPAKITYAEALARISRIECSYTRELAEFFLKTGCRYHEAATFDGETVVGKGDKRREVLTDDVARVDYPFSYSTFVRRLSRVELRPHDLRKIHLTRRRELGADAFELKEVAGWADLRSATSYVGTDRAKLRAQAKKF